MDADWLRSRLEAGPLDRVDRPRGRQAPVDRRLLGQQARPGVDPRRHGTPPAAPIDREVLAGAPRRGPLRSARWRAASRSQLHDGPALAAAARARRRRAACGSPRPRRREPPARTRSRRNCPVHGIDDVRPPRRATASAAGCAASGAVDRAAHGDQARSWWPRRAGACALCGYDRASAALQFHHLEPTEKAFALSGRGMTLSLAAAREEAAKCVLLCANCHAEVEAGLAARLRAAYYGAAARRAHADPG